MKSRRTRQSQADLQKALRYVRSKTRLTPRTAIILGSGLGEFASQITTECALRTSDIPSYPQSTVQGHAGMLLFGRIHSSSKESEPLLVFQGRVHFYESGSLSTVVFPVYLAQALGCTNLIVTNAAGGINKAFEPGHLMLITDVVYLSPPQPVGNKPGISPIMSNTGEYFDGRLQDIVRQTAQESAIILREGVYCWLKGPSYETAAEIRALRTIGADAVGMSTVPEIMAAKQLGMSTVGISLISNLATGISPQKLSHAEVSETAGRVQRSFGELMRGVALRV